jgi:hypothetical protein
MLSLIVSLLILGVGWHEIRQKVLEKDFLRDESILTVDELQNLPSGTLRVVLPQVVGSSPDNLGFRILRLCLKKSGVPFVLGYGESISDQEASVQAIGASLAPSKRNPTGLTVGLFGVGKDLQQRLRVIPIPVVGGLLGVRASWTQERRLDRFRSVEELADLRASVAIQGNGWTDVPILERSGIRVYTSEPSQILEILQYGGVDFYPRGITELEDENNLIRQQYPSIALDPHLLLLYPFAVMFHVHPDNEPLWQAIHLGFQRAHADGSYARLLRDHLFTPWLRRSIHLRRRKVIVLSNPEAEGLMAAVDPRYWLIPWGRIQPASFSRGEQLCARGLLKELCGES